MTNIKTRDGISRRAAPQRISRALLAVAAAACPALGENLLEEVVVTSSRVPMALRDVGTSISVLTAEDIEQRGFSALADTLRTQPSVAVSNTGGLGKVTSLRIRGEEGFRTMVLLDGIDMADLTSPQVSPRIDQLLSAGIERIEILRGPQGLAYGADAGGVVNMRSQSPDEGFGGRASAETGRYGTTQFSGSVGADLGAADFIVSASQLDTDGFNSRSIDSETPDDDGYENTSLHARAGWDVSDALRLEAVLRSIDGESDYDGCYSASFSLTHDCRSDFEQDSWLLRAELETGAVNHELSYAESDTDSASFSDGVFSFGSEGSLKRLSYVGRWQAGDATAIVFGLDHENESIDNGSLDRDRDQAGVFAEYQGRFDQLTVTAGVRYDDNDDFGEFSTYRVSAAYVLPVAAGDLKFKAAYGTGFRAPSLYEVGYNLSTSGRPPASDTQLQEETSEGYDLGIVWALDNGAFLELTWFDQSVDDLIEFDLVAYSGYLQTSGETDSRGVELAGRLPLPGGLEILGNFTWNDTETPAGEQRLRRPEQLMNLTLNYRSMGERLLMGVNLRSSRDAIDIGNVALDDYTVLDLNASYRFTPATTAYLRLENALDEEYEEVISYNVAGAAAYAGVRFEF